MPFVLCAIVCNYRQACVYMYVCVRDWRAITPAVFMHFVSVYALYYCFRLAYQVAYTAVFPPVVIRSFTCLILNRITHFMSAAMWTCLSVFVSVCISVCLSRLPIGLFFLYTNSSELTSLIRLCTLWTDRQTIQWKQTICLEAIGTCAHVWVGVYVRSCVCLRGVCVFKAIWF